MVERVALKTVDEASLATVNPDFLRTVPSGPPSRVPRVQRSSETTPQVSASGIDLSLFLEDSPVIE